MRLSGKIKFMQDFDAGDLQKPQKGIAETGEMRENTQTLPLVWAI
jgi:hypothetical protein